MRGGTVIRAVIFDCFGVVVDAGAYSSLLDGLSDRAARAILEINERADLGEMTHDERDDAVAPLVGGRDVLAVAREAVRQDEELTAFIRSLRGRVATGLLSNAPAGAVERVLAPDDLAELFDDVVISHAVHLLKPNPAIFALAARRLGVAPAECFFTDDDPHNVAAAVAAGLRGTVFSGVGALRDALSAAGVRP
jgi:HAD superfamily hydrolase (TIGR01509 family)